MFGAKYDDPYREDAVKYVKENYRPSMRIYEMIFDTPSERAKHYSGNKNSDDEKTGKELRGK